MATLVQIADSIIRDAQGSSFALQSKFQIPYLYDLIHQYRSLVIQAYYSKTGRVHPLWTQKVYPEYNKDLQDDPCCVKFEVPSPVTLDDQTDGFLYIGTLTKNCAFRRFMDRSELAVYNNHRVTKGGSIRTIYSDGILEVYGDSLLKELMMDSVIYNPTLVSEYNIDMSEYPLDQNSIAAMKKLIFEITDNAAKSPTNISQTMTDKPSAVK